MFFLNVFQDINHDFAQLIQYAARVCDDVISTISSFQLFEYDTPNRIDNHTFTSQDLRRTTSSASIPVPDIENQWCIVQNIDWSYDDSLRVDNSFSI